MGDDFDVRRLGEIERRIDETIAAFLRRNGLSPALRDAYEAYRRELEALWRIVMIEAREAGVPVANITATAARHEYHLSFPMLLALLRAHVSDQLSIARKAQRQRQAGARRGRGKQITEKAAAKDSEYVRLVKRYQMSDELQDTYRSPAAYIQDKTGDGTRTIQRRLKQLLPKARRTLTAKDWRRKARQSRQ